MPMPKISSNSKVTEVDTVIKQAISLFDKSDWSGDQRLTDLFTKTKDDSAKLTDAVLKLKNENEQEEKDDLRDNAFRGTYYLVQAYLCNNHPSIRAAAETVHTVIGSVGLSIVDEAYDVESSVIDSIVEKMETQEIKDAADQLPGLEMFIRDLKRSNDTFKSSRVKYKSDKAEDSEKLTASDLKKEILNHFNGKIHAYLHGMSMVDDAVYGEFSRSISQIIADNNRAVKMRQADK